MYSYFKWNSRGIFGTYKIYLFISFFKGRITYNLCDYISEHETYMIFKVSIIPEVFQKFVRASIRFLEWDATDHFPVRTVITEFWFYYIHKCQSNIFCTQKELV